MTRMTTTIIFFSFQMRREKMNKKEGRFSSFSIAYYVHTHIFRHAFYVNSETQ